MRPADLLFPDRQVALQDQRCVRPPIGCGKPLSRFDNALSEREYTISGLCQECQNEVFGPEEPQ